MTAPAPDPRTAAAAVELVMAMIAAKQDAIEIPLETQFGGLGFPYSKWRVKVERVEE